MAQSLSEFFQKYARGAGVGMAQKFKKELQRVLSVQAPTRVTRSGRIVATTRAKPYAPPRRVSGKLQSRITIVKTKNGARCVIWTPYGVPLERSSRWRGWPHKFVAVALKNLGLTGRNS